MLTIPIVILLVLLWHVFHHGLVHTLHRLVHLALIVALLACAGLYWVTTEPERALSAAVHAQKLDTYNWSTAYQSVAWAWEQGGPSGPHPEVYHDRYSVLVAQGWPGYINALWVTEHAPGFSGQRHDWAALARVRRPIAERG